MTSGDLRVRHLGETKNHLRDAFVEKYIEEQEYNAIIALNLRALKVCEGWCDYLMSGCDSVDTDQFRKRNARK